MEVVIISIRIVLFDWLNFNVNHGSCRIIKKNVENVFLQDIRGTCTGVFDDFLFLWWFFDIIPCFLDVFENFVDLDCFCTKLMIFRDDVRYDSHGMAWYASSLTIPCLTICHSPCTRLGVSSDPSKSNFLVSTKWLRLFRNKEVTNSLEIVLQHVFGYHALSAWHSL